MAIEIDPPIPSTKPPIEIESGTLPGGDPFFKINTIFGVSISVSYSHEYVLNALHKWIVDFYMAVSRGDSLKDTPFEKFKVRIRSKEEDKSAEEAWDTILRYTHRAYTIFSRAIPLRFGDVPEQFFLEVFISIIQEMEEGGVFSVEGNRADIWNDYTTALSSTIKRSWNTTLPKGSKFWNSAKRALLLEHYEYAIVPLQQWWKKYHRSAKARSKKPTREELKEAEAKYPKLYPYIRKLSKRTPPHHVALQYVSDVLEFRGYESLRAQISKARKEAKQNPR